MAAPVPMGLVERRRVVDEAWEQVMPLIDEMDAYPAAQGFARHLIDAVHHFGQCEIDVTAAEKDGAMRPRSGTLVKARTAAAMDANEVGLLLLEKARTVLEEDDTEDRRIDKETLAALRSMSTTIRRALVESPLKPKDAVHVWELWTEALDAGSIHELRANSLRRCSELIELRQSASRGTEDNIPWWKVAAIAAIVGILVWGVICCLWRVCGCPWWARAAANLVLAVAAWVLWYC